jgi:uncharacterized protein (TIGR02186 family)
MRRVALLLGLLAAPAAAEEIVAGLSHSRVSITTDFSGEEILIYGAVKREAPEPDGPPLDVIISVEGPSTPVVVRKKSRVFGIWVNTSAVSVDAAPTFYAVAATGPLHEVLSETEDLRHAISIPRAIRAVDIAGEAADAPAYLGALIRLRTADGRYAEDRGGVRLTEETLFRADVALPSNVTEGDFRVRLFLARGGRVIDAQEQVINVRKEGLERWIFNLSREEPLLYGILSLVLAVIAGAGASALFGLVRR